MPTSLTQVTAEIFTQQKLVDSRRQRLLDAFIEAETRNPSPLSAATRFDTIVAKIREGTHIKQRHTEELGVVDLSTGHIDLSTDGLSLVLRARQRELPGSLVGYNVEKIDAQWTDGFIGGQVINQVEVYEVDTRVDVLPQTLGSLRIIEQGMRETWDPSLHI